MKILITVFAVLFFALQSFAQSDNGKINQLQSTFKEIKNFSAEFSQNRAYVNGGPVLKGKFFYKKDNKFRIEFKNSVLVSDGETFWNFNKNTDQVYINYLENEYSLFSLKNIVMDLPNESKVTFLGEELIEDENFNLMQITPNESETFETMKLWFNTKSFIRKIEVVDVNGSKHSFELSNIKLNQKISEDKFKIDIPEGIEVIDLR